MVLIPLRKSQHALERMTSTAGRHEKIDSRFLASWPESGAIWLNLKLAKNLVLCLKDIRLCELTHLMDANQNVSLRADF